MLARQKAKTTQPGIQSHHVVRQPGQSSAAVEREAIAAGIRQALRLTVMASIFMCIAAGAVAGLVSWLIPAPEMRDLATEMPWTIRHPFEATHDYVSSINQTGFTVLPTGVAYDDVDQGLGHRAEDGDLVSFMFKMYLVEPQHSAGQPFRFVLSGARAGRAIHALLGHQDVLPGMEDGLRGMREGGRRKVVIPPARGHGAEGHVHALGGMRKARIPANATLLLFMELTGAKKHVPFMNPHEEL